MNSEKRFWIAKMESLVCQSSVLLEVHIFNSKPAAEYKGQHREALSRVGKALDAAYKDLEEVLAIERKADQQ